MDIIVTRSVFTKDSTISKVTIDGQELGYILEDTDRGLSAFDMDLSEIQKKKVFARTAIPIGRYQVAVTFSTRFQKALPELLHVPGYLGIRIHPGNRSTDTEGCLLPGRSCGPNVVNESRLAFSRLFGMIKARIGKEKVWVQIRRDEAAFKKFLGSK